MGSRCPRTSPALLPGLHSPSCCVFTVTLPERARSKAALLQPPVLQSHLWLQHRHNHRHRRCGERLEQGGLSLKAKGQSAPPATPGILRIREPDELLPSLMRVIASSFLLPFLLLSSSSAPAGDNQPHQDPSHIQHPRFPDRHGHQAEPPVPRTRPVWLGACPLQDNEEHFNCFQSRRRAACQVAADGVSL